MLAMDQIHRIREYYFAQHLSITEIAQAEGIDWKTAKKYILMDNFNKPSPASKKPRASKLDPFKPTIYTWLEEDQRVRPKQRQSAKRIYERLCKIKGFNCSYRLVAEYVREKVKEMNLGKSNGCNRQIP